MGRRLRSVATVASAILLAATIATSCATGTNNSAPGFDSGASSSSTHTSSRADAGASSTGSHSSSSSLSSSASSIVLSTSASDTTSSSSSVATSSGSHTSSSEHTSTAHSTSSSSATSTTSATGHGTGGLTSMCTSGGDCASGYCAGGYCQEAGACSMDSDCGIGPNGQNVCLNVQADTPTVGVCHPTCITTGEPSNCPAPWECCNGADAQNRTGINACAVCGDN